MSNEIYKYEPLWGSWKIEELIGRGSIGNVYRISKTVMNKKYLSAVKFIELPTEEQYNNLANSSDEYDRLNTEEYFKDVVENIVKEVDLLYKLKGHTNIIAYEDHMVKKVEGTNKWHILMRMEHAKSLKDYLRETTITEKEVVKIAVDMCESLIKCHNTGVLHRDIKEANIFRSEYGDYKLGDFSVSRHSDDSTQANTRVGTVNYMPPEILHGKMYNRSADIYSLGMVLYKLMNKGRLPFLPNYPEKFTAKDIENAQIKRMAGQQLQKPIEASEKFTKIILKACSSNPKDRYQSADEMKNDLLMMNGSTISSNLTGHSGTNYYANEDTAILGNSGRNDSTASLTSSNATTSDGTIGIFNNTGNRKLKFRLKKVVTICLIGAFVAVLAGTGFAFRKNVTNAFVGVGKKSPKPSSVLATSSMVKDSKGLVVISGEALSSSPNSTSTAKESTKTETHITPIPTSKPNNGGNQSQQTNSEYKPKTDGINLVLNSGAESLDKVWQKEYCVGSQGPFEFTSEAKYEGNYSLKATKTNMEGSTGFYQRVDVQKDVEYVFSAYVKTGSITNANSNNKGAYINVLYYIGPDKTEYVNNSGIRNLSSWTYKYLIFKVPSNSPTNVMTVFVGMDREIGTAYFDNIKVEKLLK